MAHDTVSVAFLVSITIYPHQYMTIVRCWVNSNLVIHRLLLQRKHINSRLDRISPYHYRNYSGGFMKSRNHDERKTANAFFMNEIACDWYAMPYTIKIISAARPVQFDSLHRYFRAMATVGGSFTTSIRNVSYRA